MSIPTSLIVVLLVVAWLVVLVPMVAKRRDKVPRTKSGGHGFRVLQRAQATLKRRPQRKTKARAADESAVPAAAAAESTADAPTTGRERTLVSVGAAEAEPRDAAEEWASVNTGYRPAPLPDPTGTDGVVDELAPEWGAGPAPEYAPQWAPDQAPQWALEPVAEWDESAPAADYTEREYAEPEQAQGTLWADESEPQPVAESVTAFPPDPRFGPEMDEQEWAEHAAAASAPIPGHQVDDEALRPTPRRRGRGGYDPEAAEATRAYKYRQRRRVTLALAGATALFTLVALLLVNWLWVGAVVSLVLLAGYLAYLRRQVKIEAQIRQRRMERLQRARQIRPEYGRGRPPVRTGRSAAGPGRTVVDLDDDDPGFDHLEAYEPPVTYRRAAGQ